MVEGERSLQAGRELLDVVPWELPCRISFQSGDGFGDVHECRSVDSENLDQRSFGVARWRLFLQVLEQFTVVDVEDLVSAEANQIM